MGARNFKSVYKSLGLETTTSEPTWEYGGNDQPTAIGLLPRPRFLVLLWQDLIRNRCKLPKIPRKIWQSHEKVVADEIEIFLSAHYRNIAPLLREIRKSNKSKITPEELYEIRSRVVDSANGATWVMERIEDLAEKMRLGWSLSRQS